MTGVDQARQAILAAAGDSARLSAVLDPTALAAAESADDLEVLLWAVDRLELALPAIRRILIDEADVDDVRQDVLVAVAETVAGYRGEARFTTWLSQVARFKAIAHLRRKRENATLDDGTVADAVRISSQLADRATLHDVLAGLPDRYREPLVLRDVHQLPYQQVAGRLGLNLNTVKSRVARGRALVAARLAAGQPSAIGRGER